jgi:hypothetical protein
MTSQDVNELMDLAGFDEIGKCDAAPYLNVADDPALLIDVLMGFGLKPHSMWRVVKALKELAEATDQPREIIGPEMLEVGPYAAWCSLDIEAVATTIGMLFKAGAKSPGTLLRNALLEAAGDREGAPVGREGVR